MPGKYGSPSITIAYDDASGAPRTVTSAILEMGGAKLIAGQQDSGAYGDTFKKKLPTGVQEVPPITMRGFFDTTATTGTHAVFGAPDTSPQAATRTLTIVFGDGKTWTSEGYLESYEVVGKFGNLTEFVAVLQQNSGVWS